MIQNPLTSAIERYFSLDPLIYRCIDAACDGFFGDISTTKTIELSKTFTNQGLMENKRFYSKFDYENREYVFARLIRVFDELSYDIRPVMSYIHKQMFPVYPNLELTLGIDYIPGKSMILKVYFDKLAFDLSGDIRREHTFLQHLSHFSESEDIADGVTLTHSSLDFQFSLEEGCPHLNHTYTKTYYERSILPEQSGKQIHTLIQYLDTYSARYGYAYKSFHSMNRYSPTGITNKLYIYYDENDTQDFLFHIYLLCRFLKQPELFERWKKDFSCFHRPEYIGVDFSSLGWLKFDLYGFI